MKIAIAFNIAEFLQKHPESEKYIATWHKLTSKGEWSSFEQMRQTFPFLEGKEKVALFGLDRGFYQLEARISFKPKQIIVRNINIVGDTSYGKQEMEDGTEELP